MLQKVLQLYASIVLAKRSYAKKGIALYVTCNVNTWKLSLQTI